MNVFPDTSHRVFVVKRDGMLAVGVSFDVAQRDAAYIAQRLGRADLMPAPAEYGTMDGYTKLHRARSA